MNNINNKMEIIKKSITKIDLNTQKKDDYVHLDLQINSISIFQIKLPLCFKSSH